MSWSGFGKNPDTRKRCTICNEPGHLASECPNQPSPAPAPAPTSAPSPAPPPPPPPARSYASAAATPITQSAAATRFSKRVVYPLDPQAAKPNPAAATFKPANAGPISAATPSAVRPATTDVPLRSTTAAPNPPPASLQKSLGPTEQKHKDGLRIGYGTRNDRLPVKDQQQAPTVLTNYVRITSRPKYVYAYKLEIVRETGADGEEYFTKDKTEKKAIFEQLKFQNGYLELQTRRDYATDHDLIWATKPLFPDKEGENSTPRPTQRFPAAHPHTQQVIAFKQVRIHFLKRIDASQSPLELFQSSVASHDGADDGAILIRGINAFIFHYARDNLDTQHYASTAANRFFLTRAPNERHLDASDRRALRAFRGFSVSTRPGVDHLLLNIHVGASPFLENVSVQRLMPRLKAMRLPPRQAFNVFRKKEAVVGDSNRHVIITRVGTTGLDDHMQSWTHLEAELSRLNFRSDLSDLPVYVSPQGPMDSDRAQDVRLHGFHAFRGAMSDDQTKEMLAFACKLPIYNRKYLEDFGFNMLGINTSHGRGRAMEFGMSVEPSLLRVPARYLAPPALRYRNNAAPRDFKEASWNLQKLQYFVPSEHIRRVMILDLHRLHGRGSFEPYLRHLEAGLTTQLRNLGLNQVSVTTAQNATQDARSKSFPEEKRLIEYLQQAGGQPSDIMLIVLPKKSYDEYANVKRVADLQMGRHVVCAVSDRMAYKGKISPQYLANVAMKINLKGAGTNHAVESSHLASILGSTTQSSTECQTIIVGADVAHPTGSARPGCPSIAAVVGSTDDDYLHYPGSMRLQVSRQEFIADLADMVKERLIDWADKHDGRLPANMLFYRDGVSESQYQTVRESEITQLQISYEMAHRFIGGAGAVPSFKLTFIVVGKRHNTRFFTDRNSQGNSFLSDLTRWEVENWQSVQSKEDQTFKKKLDERTGRPRTDRDDWTRVNHNLHPGFVVDEVITHPTSNDFFLQSHKPLQGTGRSAHYFVLTNQMGLSSDDLQRVTHALCYIYARATKGVSYCSPAYYADRLCDRGRAWLRGYLVGSMWIEKRPKENFDDFRNRARNEIDGGNYWRPSRSNNTQGSQKYGQERKNPWHPNLDDIMFYL